ncbi:Sushi domain-containing protein 5 [Oryzias melastigma]|uniref:Sushi domain-containing protein 5 n=1 Tax=Oryzias melastigma TaxID=30732 RepID=A0A834FNY9_ORYME|nr:Sushi domain-containing protein 5 [Oryzias melastigma]
MLYRLFFGCLVSLVVTSIVNADGGVFVLDLRNSSGFKGFSDAEKACASKHARLASLDELLHAVVECFFSECTRGWLYGGTVGTTVCNVAGGSLRAVDVRTENATEDAAHLDAFCITDKASPCGDPPSFPYARLQEHSGFETGDELLYTCAPGYAMPGGDTSFSLLCDSCGEWYGAVQICVKDHTESHVDYEDKYSDSYGDADHSHESREEVYGETHQRGGKLLERQDSTFQVKVQQHKEPDVRGKVTFHAGQPEGVVEEGAKHESPDHHLMGRPSQGEEKSEVVRTETAAATEEPVSVLSQKHMFWFPSEAFQEEGYPISTDTSTQTTQRTSGAQSEESKEHNSQEVPSHQQSIDVDHHDDDEEDDNGRDKDDTDDHYDDPESHQEEDRDDHGKHPALHEDVDHHTTSREDRDDHYDMGEHEEERGRVPYGSQEYDDGDDTPDDHHSVEDHDGEHPDVSKEHPDVSKEHPGDRDDHHDDHDSHERDGSRPRVVVSVAAEKHHNVSQRGTGGKPTKAETWLDGYPVAREKTKHGESKTGTSVVKMADRPNEVEVRRPATSSPSEHDSTGRVPEPDHGVVILAGTPAAFPDLLQPSDSPSYSDTLDYDTQQAAPTHSWLDDLTEQPFQDHGPAPPVHNGEAFTGVMGGHSVHNLPGETGERGELEGDMRETMCTGENCPPPPPISSGRGPKVAAIIVAVCAVATAVMVGVWCYRRQQQKSSAYEMNGKGQSQITQGQQIEMQQKV